MKSNCGSDEEQPQQQRQAQQKQPKEKPVVAKVAATSSTAKSTKCKSGISCSSKKVVEKKQLPKACSKRCLCCINQTICHIRSVASGLRDGLNNTCCQPDWTMCLTTSEQQLLSSTVKSNGVDSSSGSFGYGSAAAIVMGMSAHELIAREREIKDMERRRGCISSDRTPLFNEDELKQAEQRVTETKEAVKFLEGLLKTDAKVKPVDREKEALAVTKIAERSDERSQKLRQLFDACPEVVSSGGVENNDCDRQLDRVALKSALQALGRLLSACSASGGGGVAACRDVSAMVKFDDDDDDDDHDDSDECDDEVVAANVNSCCSKIQQQQRRSCRFAD